MEIVVNGQRRELTASTTVGAVVDGHVPARRGVAVALDGTILPRGQWDATVLPDGARLEIVGAAQGG